MKGLIGVMLALVVMALGFWAYQENYATQAALKDVRSLRSQIAQERARLDRLNAEWAYLNRPDRLSDLAELNFERLQLLPMPPEAFARVDQVAKPPESLGPLVSTYVVSQATIDGEEPL